MNIPVIRVLIFLVFPVKKCKDDPDVDCKGKTEEECRDDLENMVKDCPWSCRLCAKEGGKLTLKHFYC